MNLLTSIALAVLFPKTILVLAAIAAIIKLWPAIVLSSLN
jgi:hypothetical protein